MSIEGCLLKVARAENFESVGMEEVPVPACLSIGMYLCTYYVGTNVVLIYNKSDRV